ncbi:YbeD family protein [Marinobacterium sp. LSUCC0821]|jgi:putative lipoic acid-binding regulatory protein|uniref:YbeD family protein n=1 Tax=Marinobacterium sp. LSUCC0821 TaxID=2668067 RepID=UPI0014512549|nr:DUF493 domain-containing protein [Marinobacterium sp. LSUCC0821]QJD70217.1 DUF493 domain-containing protein [Marinobacterium sp. LSUCC0821]
MNQEPPKIEFPCPNYKIMVVGDSAPDYKEFVVATAKIYDPELDESKVEVKPSSKGRFTSVRVLITATSEEQLAQLHTDLKASGRVKMVI